MLAVDDTDPQKRLEVFSRIFQHLQHWHAQIEMGTMGDTIIIPGSGEEVYLYDLLAGLNQLEDRERQVFELVHLQGYTQLAVAKMVPHVPGHSISETSHLALEHMVAAYDQVQSGGRATMEAVEPPQEDRTVEVTVVELHEIVVRKLREARDELAQARDDRQRAAEAAQAEAEELGREIMRVEKMLVGVPLPEMAAS